MKSFYIETYGCQMNLSDSETMAGILISAGLEPADMPESADLIVVNTCAVRESAVTRVKAQISRFKSLRKEKGVKIAIAGCLAEHEREGLLKKLPVDYVVGPDHYRFLAEIIEMKSGTIAAGGEERDFYDGFPPVRKKGGNAWVPVMRGCDNYCAYCVVPYVRGREKSRPAEAVMRAVESAVAEGFPEMTLLGQNVNSYRDKDLDFAGLLRRVDAVPGLARLRFMTSHPKDLSEELLRCFGTLPSLCESLHLPVQSGSDRVLAAMNRGYTRERYLGLVERLRERVPDIALSTDVLCGFPGETEEDHARTLSLLQEVRFDAAFMFLYSPRKGTAAAAFAETLTRGEKVRRVNEVIALQMGITKEKNRACIGRTLEVRVEGISPRDAAALTARTRTHKNVILRGGPSLIGKTLTVKITGSSGWALLGETLK
ncbi:MAG: tRNA (N6-isopentenyl adenosine(37)-C2)-methylthiotransferase MiaB [Fibrobacterota bacterium]